MGIRYWASGLPPEAVERARRAPKCYFHDDPFEERGPDGKREEIPVLDLDKAWHSLQRMTEDPSARPSGWRRSGADRGWDLRRELSPRAASALVAGDVVHTYDGWTSYIGILDPEQVAAVADDLDTMGEGDVNAVYEDRDDRAHVLHYLEQAKEFAAEVRDRGWGVIYTIG